MRQIPTQNNHRTRDQERAPSELSPFGPNERIDAAQRTRQLDSTNPVSARYNIRPDHQLAVIRERFVVDEKTHPLFGTFVAG